METPEIGSMWIYQRSPNVAEGFAMFPEKDPTPGFGAVDMKSGMFMFLGSEVVDRQNTFRPKDTQGLAWKFWSLTHGCVYYINWGHNEFDEHFALWSPL